MTEEPKTDPQIGERSTALKTFANCVISLYRVILRREPQPHELAHYAKMTREGHFCKLVELLINSDEYRSLNTIGLFVPPGHFYSPIVHPANAKKHYEDYERRSVPSSLLGISLDGTQMEKTWDLLLPYLTTVPFPEQKGPTFRYAFDNPAYSWGDASILHAMLRLHRPRRLIEIGSGWSSACTIDTVEKYLDGKCELTFVEPYPQLLRDLMVATDVPHRVLEKPVQQVPLEVFEELQSGDFLFIDSTHILSTGSDVSFELFEILPRLPSGVFVHIHDMFWPFEYPRSWAIDENRSWNELYGVRAFLTNNASWRIVFFNSYFNHFYKKKIEASYSAFLRNSGGALWLQRV